EWTGHPVSFAGEPQVELFPHLSLTIADARIGAAPAGEGPPLVTMDRLTCKLRLLPFLIGRVEVAEFQLIRPHFHLALDATGRSNWRAESLPRSPDEEAQRLKKFGETRLGRFRVVDGRASFLDARNGRREEIFGMA